ncbi:hypothetical protein [Staphylococcus pseudintermedius]|uniref:hypothetical protein n=1 Tax=Staphylococcus pseudintermedius TaxID=283734 RepID=UPI0018F605D3|nr:hypothetical protein [Staphylococcus pseudintermedius]EJJ6374256.1 hypothetical protein [Staphylococcus pseudintermedius]MBJ8318386.1 hypothetical protein [Staphylococcus pseudintermedius]
MYIIVIILAVLTVIAWITAIRSFRQTGQKGKINPNTWVIIGAVLTTLTIMMMFIFSQN